MSKYNQDEWYSAVTQNMRVQDVIIDMDARLSAIEDVAHTPSEAECKPQEAGMPVYDHAGFPMSYYTLHDLVRQLHNPTPGFTASADVIEAELERRIEAAKSATETPAANAQLYVRAPGLYATGNGLYEPATLAQIRQAAVDAGLLDTPRQKVAEAFLHATELSEVGVLLDSYKDVAEWLNDLADITMLPADDMMLRRMATVLEATKGEQNVV